MGTRGDWCRLFGGSSKGGPLETRRLTDRVIAAKGLEGVDEAARKSITFRVVRVLMNAKKRGMIGDGGKRKGVRIWVVS